ncbi:hypothetical protein SANTM175S_05085 [Streptomyces antimycoticus]
MPWPGSRHFSNELGGRREQSNREHRAIVEALADGSEHDAVEAMTHHLERVETTLTSIVRPATADDRTTVPTEGGQQACSEQSLRQEDRQQQQAGPPAHVDAGDAGYSKSLKARHVNMIAIGGAIGTGLFLGAGGRLKDAGPSLAVAYAVCGIFAFLVVRALGELVLHRPSSGAFVSYAREFLGEKGAFVAGWMYFLNWATTGVADITAVATYTHYWGMFTEIPQWVIALIALAVVLTVNLISVKIFGELEFWFAIIKVGALVVFMAIGIFLLVTREQVAGTSTGPSLITDHGGVFPHGVLPMLLVIQGVVFAYASVELVGVAAGETENPEKIMPKAINSIMWRVGLFYVGSVVLLSMLLPSDSYSGDQSPFVTVLSKIGVPAAGGVMNLVVLTAAMSSSQLRSLLHRPDPALDGDVRLRAQVHRRHEPYPGALRRHPAHCLLLCAGRGPELCGAGQGVRDRAQLRRDRHPLDLGRDHALSSAVLAACPGRSAHPPRLPASRLPVHRDRHPGLPGLRPRPDVGGRRSQPTHRDGASGDPGGAGHRLVRVPRPDEGPPLSPRRSNPRRRIPTEESFLRAAGATPRPPCPSTTSWRNPTP